MNDGFDTIKYFINQHNIMENKIFENLGSIHFVVQNLQLKEQGRSLPQSHFVINKRMTHVVLQYLMEWFN